MSLATLSCQILSAQNFDRYKPPTLPPSPAPGPDIEPALPPITGSDTILLESLDAVIVFDKADKVSPDEDRPDAEGILYNFPDKKSLVYSARFQQIVNSYLGQPVSLQSINQMSRDIINLYRSHKQPIVDVFVPEQKITGGTIQIVVISSGEVTPDIAYYAAKILLEERKKDAAIDMLTKSLAANSRFTFRSQAEQLLKSLTAE